jgi:hypothetical protein
MKHSGYFFVIIFFYNGMAFGNATAMPPDRRFTRGQMAEADTVGA